MADNGIIEGFVDRVDPPQARLPIRLTWKEDLPEEAGLRDTATDRAAYCVALAVARDCG
jgi:hypothetical protein